MFGLENIDFIKKLKDNIFFFDIFCLINTLIIFFIWSINKEFSTYYILIMFSITLIIFNQIKLTLPFIVYTTLTITSSFQYSNVLICLAVVTAITMLTYAILNKPKIKLGKHGIFFLLLGFSTLIPILWWEPVNTLSDGNKAFYFIGIICFLIYLLIKTSKESILEYVIKTFSYIPLLLMLELVWYYFTNDNVGFAVGIKLGWGGGNHSSMMMIVSFSFIMYRLYKENNKFIPTLLMIVTFIGIYFTFSRAGILVFIIQLIMFIIFSLYYYRSFFILNKIYKIIWKFKYVVLPIVCIIFIYSIFNFLNLENRNEILDKLFNDSGRINIYIQGVELFISNFRNFLFGRGLINDYLYSTRFLLYHNTIVQVIVTGGLVMVVIMAVHAFHKYIPLIVNTNLFTICTLIGFITTELYGMLDSTYFTNYYMVTLVIILCCFEIDEKIIFKKEEISPNLN